jgi:UrcA family protein
MSTKTKLAAVSALATLAIAAAAQAAPEMSPSSSDDTVSVKVFLADLDLSSPAGARVVLQRIRNAARAICGDEPAPAALDRAGPYRACVATTIDGAVASLGAPMVTALNGHARPAEVVAANNR